jgi:hypothetical protein
VRGANDLRNDFRATQAVIGYVDKHFPDAEDQMREGWTEVYLRPRISRRRLMSLG